MGLVSNGRKWARSRTTKECAAQEIEMASSRGSAKKKKENQGVHWPDGGCEP